MQRVLFSAVSIPKRLFSSTSQAQVTRGKDWLMSYFPELVKCTSAMVRQHSNDEVAQHYEKAFNYFMVGGKKSRGLATVESYVAFSQHEISDSDLALAAIIGLTVEMTQEWAVVLDDIVDGSITRSGRPCWYRTEVGLGAINDAVLVSKLQPMLLKKYIGHLTCHDKIQLILNEVHLRTMIGQIHDVLSGNGRVSAWDFNLQRYMGIVNEKTGCPLYTFPVQVGMALANFDDPAAEQEVSALCHDIGNMFQIQDDFLDCFADPAVFKEGTDIDEGKLTWLAVQMMLRGSEAQKQRFVSIYGKLGYKAEVKALYEDAGLVETYRKLEDENAQKINERINHLPANVPRDLFIGIVNSIYRREY